MRCSEDTLSEDQVDNEEQQDAGTDKDRCSYANLDIVWEASPDDSQDHSHYSSHAEAEGESTHDELVTSSFVDLKDGHVGPRRRT